MTTLFGPNSIGLLQKNIREFCPINNLKGEYSNGNGLCPVQIPMSMVLGDLIVKSNLLHLVWWAQVSGDG